MKRASKMRQALFISFKGLPMKQIKQFFLEGETPILNSRTTSIVFIIRAFYQKSIMVSKVFIHLFTK